MGEDDGEEVGGSAAGRRKKMRTTFTGKQVSVLTSYCIAFITILIQLDLRTGEDV